MSPMSRLRDKARQVSWLAEAYRAGIRTNARLRSAARIREYLQGPGAKRLMLGAGSNAHPGWLASDLRPSRADVVYLDATVPFPLPSQSFDFVFSEHMIEHIPWSSGRFMLEECRRVLKPGGVLRISTPDLAFILSLYGREDDEAREYVDWVMGAFMPDQEQRAPHFVINNAFRAWGHQFLYDRALLTRTLGDVGFAEIRECSIGESERPELRRLEAHGQAVGNPRMVAIETFVLEAQSL